MACFLVPMAEAIATTIVRKKNQRMNSSRWKKELPTLEKMLWGGTLMLLVDHVIHGELTLSFPFFSALGQENGALLFGRELLFEGVPMALVITLVWLVFQLFRAVSRHQPLIRYKADQ